MSAVVLLAHGSPDPRSAAGAVALADVVADRMGQRTAVAFLQNDARTLSAVVGGLADDESIVVVPLFLSRAFHVRVDVPAAVAVTGRPLTVTAALGPDESLLRSAETDLGGGPYVLASAGTTDLDALAEMHSLADAAAARRGHPVVAGFASSAQPDIATALAVAESTGRGRASVLSFVLFPGVLPDRIHAAAQGRTVTAPLGARSEVVDLIAQRIAEAA